MKQAVIVSGARTAVGRAPRGSLRASRPDDMAGAAIAEALRRAEGLDPAEVEDVLLGCAITEGSQGLNVARIAAQRAGLPDTVPGQTVNRFCSSGLQTIASAAERIMAGFATTVVAGGTEHMSSTPTPTPTFSPNPEVVRGHPEYYMAMGLTGERVAERVEGQPRGPGRLRPPLPPARGRGGRLGPVRPRDRPPARPGRRVGGDGRPVQREGTFERDEGPRRDTSAEALAKLKPVFKQGGTVTAGNSSQRSDGAAAVVVMERERAERLGLQPLGRFVGYAVGGVAPDVMGIGPTVAVPKVLELTGLPLDDIDLIELNEAFASQTLAVIRELGLDLDKVNVNGGAIALGHPMGATGTKLTVQLLAELARRKARYGMVTMCVGGGQGAAGIFENLQN